MRIFMAIIAMLAFCAEASIAEEYTIFYLEQHLAPNSDFLIAELPSFYFVAGSPIAVVYRLNAGSKVSVVRATQRRGSAASDDLNCDQISAPVFVGGNDPNRLDGDGDGWGCE